MPVYREAREIDFRLDELPAVPPPDRVLLADPRDFDVKVALNPHMLDESGRLKSVDRRRAREQWESLRRRFVELGFAVDVIRPSVGLTDLVFCANQALPLAPWVAGAPPRVVPARMASPSRAPEVPIVVGRLEQLGYRAEPLEGGAEHMEGMGDGLWHPGRRLLWAGVGPRSDAAAWEELAERYDLPVVLLETIDPDFYHLDTCLALLDEASCLAFPPALAPRSRELVAALFERVIEAPEDEARERLACNACAAGKCVLLSAGCPVTRRRLEAAGFEVVEVETGEFLKSGGSVFCMKLMHGPG